MLTVYFLAMVAASPQTKIGLAIAAGLTIFCITDVEGRTQKAIE